MDGLLRRLREKKSGSSQRSQSRLASDFLQGKVHSTSLGHCYLIRNEYQTCPSPEFPEAGGLTRKLQLLYGVGPKIQARLIAGGIETLHDALLEKKWESQARELLAAIETRDVKLLKSCGAAEDELLALYDPEEVAFVDLETMGLYHVLPLFLIGIAYWRDNRLYLCQYLARSFEEEAPALEAALGRLREFPVLITYNGKQFDLPYFNGRARVFGLEQYWPALHVDLLNWVRRSYRDLLPDCRLTTAERYLLSYGRVGDVPGRRIPELYNEFVRKQDPDLIEGILIHNARDLVSLAHLLRLRMRGPTRKEHTG